MFDSVSRTLIGLVLTQLLFAVLLVLALIPPPEGLEFRIYSVGFASARDRAEFAQELSAVVDSLVEKYHDAGTPGARRHRLVLALPATPAHDITDTPDKEQDHE